MGKRISSRKTFLLKKVFPILWFVLLAYFILTLVGRHPPNFMLLVPPLVMTVFVFFLMKHLIWNLVDEVYDCGDFLLVKNAGEEENVALSNVMNVSDSMLINPPRITLRLLSPGKFGKEIAFSPIRTFTLNPFAKNPVAEDLIIRVDQARSKRAG